MIGPAVPPPTPLVQRAAEHRERGIATRLRTKRRRPKDEFDIITPIPQRRMIERTVRVQNLELVSQKPTNPPGRGLTATPQHNVVEFNEKPVGLQLVDSIKERVQKTSGKQLLPGHVRCDGGLEIPRLYTGTGDPIVRNWPLLTRMHLDLRSEPEDHLMKQQLVNDGIELLRTKTMP
jgi:hypothetical protein